jgi:hypothetical protein
MVLEQAKRGVGVLKGFGHGWDEAARVHGRTAIYLQGRLVGVYTSLAEGHGIANPDKSADEVMATFLVLAEQLAALQNLPWAAGRAHALWSLPLDAVPPLTLDEYEAQTCEWFAKSNWNEAFATFRESVLHSNPTLLPLFNVTVRMQEQAVYSLSGGDLGHFARWHQGWSGKSAHFMKSHEVGLARVRELLNRQDEGQQVRELLERLEGEWKEALHEIWRTPKPLDPVADKAKHVKLVSQV